MTNIPEIAKILISLPTEVSILYLNTLITEIQKQKKTEQIIHELDKVKKIFVESEN